MKSDQQSWNLCCAVHRSFLLRVFFWEDKNFQWHCCGIFMHSSCEWLAYFTQICILALWATKVISNHINSHLLSFLLNFKVQENSIPCIGINYSTAVVFICASLWKRMGAWIIMALVEWGLRSICAAGGWWRRDFWSPVLTSFTFTVVCDLYVRK